MSCDLTFVIPAYNEEKYLPETLRLIQKYTPDSLRYEIIVADNGSTDDTVLLARENGAKVVCNSDTTVAGLRNLAVSRSNGQILVFLDSDVRLTKNWGRRIPEVVTELQVKPMRVTGSRCGISLKPSWVEVRWFKPLMRLKRSYINSGHLVTTRLLFDKAGGFPEDMETGEDYAFCSNARQAGAEIVEDPELEVVHEGYPKTLMSFVKREMWHGRGDCVSLSSIASSRVAMASIFFAVLNIAALSVVFLCEGQCAVLLALFVSMIVLQCVLSAYVKHRASSAFDILYIGMLYYFYYLARFASCAALFSADKKRHERTM